MVEKTPKQKFTFEENGSCQLQLLVEADSMDIGKHGTECFKDPSHQSNDLPSLSSEQVLPNSWISFQTSPEFQEPSHHLPKQSTENGKQLPNGCVYVSFKSFTRDLSYFSSKSLQPFLISQNWFTFRILKKRKYCIHVTLIWHMHS